MVAVAPDSLLKAEAEQIRSTAEELRRSCRQVVTIGLFGAYNTGKSLALGTLLGNPCLLPVMSEPATANITRLRLVPGDSRHQATISEATAVFSTDKQLTDLLAVLRDHCGQELRKTASYGAELAADALTQLPPNEQAVPEIYRQVQAHAQPGSALADLLTEVRGLLAALTFGGRPAPGTELPLDPTLPWSLMAAGLRESGSGADLAPVRPLVREVRVTVRVPAWGWDLHAFGGAEVQLLDIPGHGSQSFRDTHIAFEELPKVTAALAFFNATRASAKESWEFVDRLIAHHGGDQALQRRLLIAASRFDTLEGVPGSLQAHGAGLAQLSEDDFLGLDPCRSLRAAVTAIRARLSTPDRFVFLSPLVFLARTDRSGEQRWDLDQVTEILQNRQDVDAAAAKADGWRTLTLPTGPVGDAIRDFGGNGGLDRLKDQLTRYVRGDGLDAHLRDVAARAHDLAQRLEQVRQEIAEQAEAASPAVLAATQLRDALRTVGRAIPTGEELIRKLAGFTDPSQPLLPGTRALRDLLEEAAAHEVYSWPQWASLFARVRDGLITIPPAGDGAADARAKERRERFKDRFRAKSPVGGADLGLPTTAQDVPPPIFARDFFEPYRASLANLVEVARTQVLTATEQWIRDWAQSLATETDTISRILGQAGSEHVHAHQLLADLGPLLQPDETVKFVREPLHEEPLDAEPTAFPLDDIRALPWHPESPRRDHADRVARAHALRLRKAFVEALLADSQPSLRILLTRAREEVDFLLREVRGPVEKEERYRRAVEETRAFAAAAEQAGQG